MKKFAALLLATVASVGSAQAEDAVLVSSSVPEYAAGSIITDTQTLKLPQGGSATLLLKNGALLRIKGPFQSTLAARNKDGGNSAIALVQDLKNEGADVSVLGASRSLKPDKTMRGQRVVLDVKRSGTYCVSPGDHVWLRKSDGNAVEMRAGSAVRQVAFPKGATEVELPQDIRIEDGMRVETVENGKPMATLTIRKFSAPATEQAWVAESMLLGCTEQAEPKFRELTKNIAKE